MLDCSYYDGLVKDCTFSYYRCSIKKLLEKYCKIHRNVCARISFKSSGKPAYLAEGCLKLIL